MYTTYVQTDATPNAVNLTKNDRFFMNMVMSKGKNIINDTI